MEWTQENKEIGKAFNLAVRRGQIEEMERLFAEYPWLLCDQRWDGRTWLEEAVSWGRTQAAAQLLDWGFDVNAQNDDKSTALRKAVMKENFELAKYLIDRGANPNLDRVILTAINLESEDSRLPFLQLLVDAGADVNQVFLWFDKEDAKFTALDRVEDEDEVIIRYLRSKGAKSFGELQQI